MITKFLIKQNSLNNKISNKYLFQIFKKVKVEPTNSKELVYIKNTFKSNVDSKIYKSYEFDNSNNLADLSFIKFDKDGMFL